MNREGGVTTDFAVPILGRLWLQQGALPLLTIAVLGYWGSRGSSREIGAF